MPPDKIFIGKYELTAIHLPADGDGPTELHLTPVNEKDTSPQGTFARRYLCIYEREGPLILRIEDVRLLQLLKINQTYHVTFQQAE